MMTIDKALWMPLIFAFLCLIPSPKRITRLTFIAGAVISAIGAWGFVFGASWSPRVFAFNGNLMMDALSAVFALLITGVGVLSAVYAGGYLFKEGDGSISPLRLRRYACFFHLFLFTMLLTVFSNNLGIMWIAIEGTTLASAFLVNVDDKKSSIEAAWKYLILCSVGISLALFGIILVYYSAIAQAASGESGLLLNWTFLLSKAKQLDPQVLRLAFIFILVGYGTKAGLAPFHSWLPDAHSQAPAPVSALLSGVLLSCATLGILRFHILTKAATGSAFSDTLLIFFGVLSVVVATPFILEQKDYKRLLAYSSVEHMGLAAAGLGFGGALGLYGAILHIMNHAFTKSLLFFSSGHLYYLFHSKEIADVKGLLRKNAFLGIIFFLAALAIAGMPPFSIFVSEFLILSAGFLGGKYISCAVLLLFLALIFVGFLRHASRMTLGGPNTNQSKQSGDWGRPNYHFGKEIKSLGGSEEPPKVERSLLMDSVLVVGMIVILTMGFYIPGPLNALIQAAGRIAGGTIL
ncbi:MAG TPA: hydrogenase 4 subunit F [Candidatus Omnitrophota bacterium]|nr:hydrogenase 4 subunit F [Candidatus Omnitrophota bacterium]HRY85772.1 hydrogenase 4 subunit F [Candidatus Omnitrophota bacterium]